MFAPSRNSLPQLNGRLSRKGFPANRSLNPHYGEKTQ
jgi:hypothetical protein